ncbi:T/G mismatch-specific endonuclease [Psychrobacillus sp. OK028]|uniref:very short patch repair endonuclease n=1 Tax=Psychrobacillus sp. OK028 TaxID=1884359 RepID=UPI0008861DF8|nr:very short patch repair endonuclease [Psychrobacillus sp. OK028]SDN60501.1 T/G mismatch-specific endonuclease [Psychrobacillus sp. OK028]
MSKNVPKASSQAVFKTMSGNRGKDTKLELMVRHALWKDGYRYRKNNRRLLGTPDISFPNLKIVVFLDSCYWHGCPTHFKMPKTNTSFWHQKINRNIERDYDISSHYSEEGWTLLRFWEHEVKNDLDRVVKTIEYFVDEKKKQ